MELSEMVEGCLVKSERMIGRTDGQGGTSVDLKCDPFNG